QLRVGVFIRLEMKWYAHPFLLNSFRISRQEQIDALRDLGLETVVCIPEKSDVLPLSASPVASYPSVAKPLSPEMSELWELKKKRREELKKRRQSMEDCEKKFSHGVNAVRNIMRNIHTASPETVSEAEDLLHELIAQLATDKESSVQLMNTEMGTENNYYHSLNVSVLAMLLGRQCGLDDAMLRLLGLGALFHDVGKSRVPKSITAKTVPLSQAEAACLQLHPKYGEAILSKVPSFPKEAVDIVLHHHELFNGKGYPDRLSGEQISVLTRITSIVNSYDNYCNSLDPHDSMTPYEALSLMFARKKDIFDQGLLATFIQCLGVYPPGTIVRLSNDLIGMVISVSPAAPLRPSVVVYDPEVPKSEAIIFDLLDDPSISIESSIRPSHLEPEVYAYLSPRARVTYYLASSGSISPGVKLKPGEGEKKQGGML
ncbi:MAG: HD-GYP domain-containing protein, partial [Nitrospirales bacterium]|nr:HD-GYP domain-containing protein [Nitrospirales bacterium]